MKIAQKPPHCPDLCGAKEKQEKRILSWSGQMMVEPHTTEVALECVVCATWKHTKLQSAQKA